MLLLFEEYETLLPAEEGMGVTTDPTLSCLLAFQTLHRRQYSTQPVTARTETTKMAMCDEKMDVTMKKDDDDGTTSLQAVNLFIRLTFLQRIQTQCQAPGSRRRRHPARQRQSCGSPLVLHASRLRSRRPILPPPRTANSTAVPSQWIATSNSSCR